jgi:hypothetical protein
LTAIFISKFRTEGFEILPVKPRITGPIHSCSTSPISSRAPRDDVFYAPAHARKSRRVQDRVIFQGCLSRLIDIDWVENPAAEPLVRCAADMEHDPSHRPAPFDRYKCQIGLFKGVQGQ